MTRSLFDQIENGPDWLEHPDVIEFLRRHGLSDVRVQLVGPRRTFAGKTWPAQGFMRMVGVGVHPIRWLLTFVHELAHVKDFRRRAKDLEHELGRPLEHGRRDGRRVWQMDRPHGQRWRHEFIKLATAAVEAGLFPGNEDRVIAVAEAGETSLDHVELDLCADARVCAEDLRRLDEAHRRQIERAQRQTADFKSIFKVGQEVHFDAGARQGVVTGTLIRINRSTCTVEASAYRWHVPHGLLKPGASPPGSRKGKLPPSRRDRFSPGDEVYFRYDGLRHEGKIVRVNRKTCTVETLDGKWRVAFSLLKPLRKPTAS
ncbi:MAG: hypothetical protein ABFE08_00905 [Armatimonadia bacterium]